jgi:hypothetical protein
MTRDEKLARYRHLRAISTAQQTAALERVSADAILDIGRRLGLVHGRTLVCDESSELDLIYDLAVHTGKAGRSRGIERYARSVAPTLTGDETMMLHAAQAAHFKLWRIERPHETLGLWTVDIVTRETMWLIDEGMEATCRPGHVFAARLMAVDDFAMTCGVSIPLSAVLLATAMARLPNIIAANREEALNDPRFALLIYRSAIETGTMEGMQFMDSDELALELADRPPTLIDASALRALPTDHPPADLPPPTAAH